MNNTHVRAGRLAGLHRQTLRARGAALAIKALNDDARGPALRGFDGADIAVLAYAADDACFARSMRHGARRDVGYDTRLARANGWGSAGDTCPAGHDAKTPAAREQVAASRRRFRNARRVATIPGRDTSACASAQQTREAIA